MLTLVHIADFLRTEKLGTLQHVNRAVGKNTSCVQYAYVHSH